MFDKNIEALKEVNNVLAEKLIQFPSEKMMEGLRVMSAQSGDYVLEKDGIVLDNLENPVEGIKKDIFNNIKTSPSRTDFILIFGIGMGYILDEVFLNFESKILLYEPDLALLRFLFENVDLSLYFASGRLYIASDAEDCCKYINSHYLSGDKLEITFPKNYLLKFHKEIIEFSEKIYQTCKNKIIDVNTIKQLSGGWVTNVIENTKNLNDSLSFFDIENKFTGTALVLGAGPSLKKNIELIKENRNKFTILAVNRALSLLEKEGITPDFAVFCDAYYIADNIKISDETYFKNMNFIADIKSEPYVFKLPSKRKIVYHPDNELIVKQIARRNNMKLNESYGTTSALALSCACKMGFEKIICCGIDLAFENDKAYGDDTGKIVDNSIIVDKATKRLTEVKSINGEMVKTREDYASFIPHFESICEKHSSVKIYNVTEFGAYINGMEYSHLSKLIPVNDKFEVDNILEKIVPEKIYYAPTINEEYEKAKEIVVGLISGQKDVNEIMTKLQKSLFLYEFCQLSIIDYLKTEGDENSKSEFKNSIFTAWAKIEKAMDNYCTV